jgi:hypothetical protein
MQVKRRYIIQHDCGKFINLHYEFVTDIDKAARFSSQEEAEHFFKESYYKADKPEEYRAVPMKITYELEVEPNGTQLSEKAGTCDARSEIHPEDRIQQVS